MANKKGFTLIELLVVVLIIGILGAIALPKYQAATLKARISNVMPMVNAIAIAQESYHLATGKFAKDVSELDVTLPSSFSCSGTYCKDPKYPNVTYQFFETGGAMRVVGYISLKNGSQILHYLYHACPTKEIRKSIVSSYGSIKYFEVNASGSDKELLMKVAASMGGKQRGSGSGVFLL